VAQPNRKAKQIAPVATESKNRNLVLRLLTALVLIPIVLGCIYWGGLALTTLAAVAAGLNALELGAMSLGKDRLRWLAALAAFAMPYFFTVSSLGAHNIHWLWAGLVIATLTWRLLRNAPVDSAGKDVSSTVFAGVYGSMVGYVVPLRNLGELQSWRGGGWVLLACVLTWINDTGAYFAGRFLGKRKLYPRISPAKTWEGFFGGMASSILGAFVVRFLVLDTMTPFDCIALGVLGGIIGPIGDLAESMLKRSFKVKDSGQLLPGHGGMLDRVDALMLNAPVVYFYYQLVVLPRGTP
jgi:phosphatidate cytidylyltransferase